MELGQVMKYIKRNIFCEKTMRKMRQGDQFRTYFCFFKIFLDKVNAKGL